MFPFTVSVLSSGFIFHNGDSLISLARNISCSYHTYLSFSDIISKILETLDYLDNLRKRELLTEQGDTITFESEMDRTYLGSSS
ncbi:hypothetical protein Bca4012_033311 [Brassica carinata]